MTHTQGFFGFIVFRQLLHDEPMSRSPEIKMLVDLQNCLVQDAEYQLKE